MPSTVLGTGPVAAILENDWAKYFRISKDQNYVDESLFCVKLWSAKVCEQCLIVINTKLNVSESRKPTKSKKGMGYKDFILFEQDYEI